MKKRIIVSVFVLIILFTATVFVVGAISSYNADVKAGFDKWVGFGAVVTLMVGGYVVFYEFDLFYTVYYFFIKPKTLAKSLLNIFSNFTLVAVFFTDSISYFLSQNVSKIFSEEITVSSILFCIYVILRIGCVVISFIQSEKKL